MCLLFETIRIYDGLPINLEWHEARMNLSRLELWNLHKSQFLSEIIKVPEGLKTGLVKCRLTYGAQIESVTYQAYIKRPVNSLKLIESNDIDYHLKKFDRSILNDLFSCKGYCDEIIIIKNGFVTDTSISNLIFFDGKNWVTPQNPLLNGTCRQRLLKEGKISEKQLLVEDLWHFSGLKLINAMCFPEEEAMIPMTFVSW